MIEAAQLRKGTVIDIDGDLMEVVEAALSKMGRGGATVKTKLRNLDKGSVVDKTFNSNERLNDVRLETRRVQFLYTDGDLYHFMDLETFEQPVLGKDAVDEVRQWLIENMELSIAMHEGRSIRIELPTTVDLEVAEAPPGFKGDTASGGTKPVVLSNGVTVNVPFFVERGNVIRVDTRNGNYVTRVN